MDIFYTFLTYLAPFLDNLTCYICIMFTFILKKISNFKKYQDLDAKFWIQKALISKNFKKISY
jgi:hypothetical protein